MKGMNEANEKFFHLVMSSKAEVICRDEKDYLAFQNSIGKTAVKCGVVVLAYSVMSNHVHIGIVCTDPVDFVNRVRMSYIRYFNNRYLHRGAIIQDTYCMEVPGYLRQKVAVSYILRNPLHHGVCEIPHQYAYSSISAYFSKTFSGMRTGMSSENQVVASGFVRLRCGTKLPTDDRGRILLSCFVNAGRVEYIFKTVRSFIHSMNRWNTDDWEREQKQDGLSGKIVSLDNSEPSYSGDLESMRAYEKAVFHIRASDEDICRYIDHEVVPAVGLHSYVFLSDQQKVELVRKIMSRFHVREEQASRCLGRRR